MLTKIDERILNVGEPERNEPVDSSSSRDSVYNSIDKVLSLFFEYYLWVVVCVNSDNQAQNIAEFNQVEVCNEPMLLSYEVG